MIIVIFRGCEGTGVRRYEVSFADGVIQGRVYPRTLVPPYPRTPEKRTPATAERET